MKRPDGHFASHQDGLRSRPDLSRLAVNARDLRRPEALLDLASSCWSPSRAKALLRQSSARWLMADRTLESLERALSAQAIPWLALKGTAVGLLDYPIRELRPISDVDILIDPSLLNAASEALRQEGWSSFHPPTPAGADYMRRLGYCWQARRQGHLLCEVHFRLWGSLPSRSANDLLCPATHASGLPHADCHGEPTRLPAPPAAQRYLLAAVHAWMVPSPRPLHCWWDLEWISARTEFDELLELSRLWGCRLQVALARRQANSLFGTPGDEDHTRALEQGLRVTERWLLRKSIQKGEAAVTQSQINLARLLSGRSMRLAGSPAGLASAFWPHRHTVEIRTPAHYSSPRRRALAQLRQFRLTSKDPGKGPGHSPSENERTPGPGSAPGTPW